MTTVYNNTADGSYRPPNGDRGDAATRVYDDSGSGGFMRVYFLEASAGAVIGPHLSYRGSNNGKPKTEQLPSRTTVVLSGQKVVEELDDNNVVTKSDDTGPGRPGGQHGGHTKGYSGIIRGNYPVDTTMFCIMALDRDIITEVPHSTITGESINVGGPNTVIALYKGSVELDGNTYDAPYCFYSSSPRGTEPVALTPCEWKRLTVVDRT